MATELAKIDDRRPLATLSLPEWLQLSVNALAAGSEEVTRADGAKARMRIWTIPKSALPSPTAQREIANRITDLRRLITAIDVDAALTKVTEMLLAFPMPSGGESAARARARGYVAALDDLPAWAVVEACRKWLRGEAGDEHNYAFSPTPPVLRKLAEGTLLVAKVQLDKLEQLLEARPVDDPIEFDDQHCKRMRVRIADLLRRPKEAVA